MGNFFDVNPIRQYTRFASKKLKLHVKRLCSSTSMGNMKRLYLDATPKGLGFLHAHCPSQREPLCWNAGLPLRRLKIFDARPWGPVMMFFPKGKERTKHDPTISWATCLTSIFFLPIYIYIYIYSCRLLSCKSGCQMDRAETKRVNPSTSNHGS